MRQVNDTLGTARAARRTADCGGQRSGRSKSSPRRIIENPKINAMKKNLQGNLHFDSFIFFILISGSSTPPRWQFQDIGGVWRDYSKGSSISSQDLELQYQQNPSGSVNFTTRNFRYELNFSGEQQTATVVLKVKKSCLYTCPDLHRMALLQPWVRRTCSQAPPDQCDDLPSDCGRSEVNVDPHTGLDVSQNWGQYRFSQAPSSLFLFDWPHAVLFDTRDYFTALCVPNCFPRSSGVHGVGDI